MERKPDHPTFLDAAALELGGPRTLAFLDQCERLIHELRVLDPEIGDPHEDDGEPVHVYDLEYAYDQLGNRTKLNDYGRNRATWYVYDVDYPDPCALDFPTRNNRLLGTIEDVYDEGQDQWYTDRIVRYAYYPDGNVSNITIWDEGDVSKDLYLICGTNGTLWLAIWQEWDGEMPPAEEDIRVTDAWEFQYDSGRERYLARHWNVSHEPGQYPVFTEGDSTWTDYLGPQPYVDYTVESGSPPVIEEQMRYLAGLGVHAQESAGVPPAGPSRDRQGAGFAGDAGLGGPALLGSASSQPVIGAPVFLHGDLTRSTMMTTTVGGGGGGTGVSPVVAYTSFGDSVTPDGQGGWRVGFPAALGTRYQYDGGWGYESGLISLFGEDETLPPVTLQHVGWRWYQPSLGRFVQRDPIGLGAGLNVYVYVENDPVAASDPSGLGNFGSLEAQATYRGLRESGKSPEEASDIMRESAKDEVVIAGGWCVVLGGGALIALLPKGCGAPKPYRLAPPDSMRGPEWDGYRWDPRWGVPPPLDDVLPDIL